MNKAKDIEKVVELCGRIAKNHDEWRVELGLLDTDLFEPLRDALEMLNEQRVLRKRMSSVQARGTQRLGIQRKPTLEERRAAAKANMYARDHLLAKQARGEELTMDEIGNLAYYNSILHSLLEDEG